MSSRRKGAAEVTIPIKMQLDTDEAVKDLQEFAKTAKTNVSSFSAAKRILDGFEKSAKEAFNSDNVDKMTIRIMNLQKEAASAAKAIMKSKDMFKEVYGRQAIREQYSDPKAREDFLAQDRELRDRIASIRAEMQKLALPAIGKTDYFFKMQESFNKAEMSVAKLVAAQKRLEDEGKKGTDEWKRLAEAITSAKRSSAGYKSQMSQAMKSNEVVEAKKRYEELDATLKKLLADQKSFDYILKILDDRAGFETGDKSFIERFERLAMAVKFADLQVRELEKSTDKLNGKGKDNDAFARGFYLIRTAINDVSKGLNGLLDKFKKLGHRIAEAAKHMLHLNEHGTKTHRSLSDGFKMALKNIMRYGFGIRSLYFLFRRLRKYAVEALGEMAKAFPEVNAQMSRAVTALNQMKGSIGTAIQPLLNVLVPVLEKVANLISKIMSLVGSLFAMITGQGKIYQAVATQTDYAASLDKTGASAKKAKKELEGYLSPIDEINKYKTNKDDSGGGAGGAGYELVEAPINPFAQKIMDIINKILDPIKKAWARVGEYVKRAWMTAFNSVKKLVTDIGRDFLEVWNQPATVKMLENIFRIVANIGNIIAYLAKNLDDAWNKNQVGLHILEKIRDIFAIIVEHILSASRYTVVWAKNLNFSPLLEAFNTFLESLKPVIDNIAGVVEDFYKQVLLPLTKWTIEKGLPELLGVFEDFNNKVDWDGLRSKLSELWEALEPFAERVGEGLIMFIDDISEKLADFLNSETFDKLVDGLTEFINSLTAEDIEGTLWGIVNAFIALKAAATGFEILGKLVLHLKELTLVVKNWDVISGIVSKLSGILLLIGGLATAITNFVSMWKNGWSAISTILEALGIALAVIGAIILGAPALIAAIVGAVIFAISQIAIVVHDNWDAIKQFFSDLWDSIVSIFSPLVEWFVGHIIEPLVNFWKGFFSRVKSIFEGLWIIIKAIWIVVSTWFNTKVIQPVVKLWTGFKTTISTIFTNIVSGIKTVFSPIISWFNAHIITPLKQIFDTVWNAITSGAKNAFNGIMGFVERAVNGIIDGVNKFFGFFNAAVQFAGKITGDSYSGIQLIDHVSLPRLAQGAVIPPNKEFMAMLGDQKAGTNIETPLATMVEAFNQALAQNGGAGKTEINFLLPDRRKVAQYVLEGGRIMQTSTGRNPFELT